MSLLYTTENILRTGALTCGHFYLHFFSRRKLQPTVAGTTTARSCGLALAAMIAGFGTSRLHTDGKARLASIRVRCCSTATSPANGIPVRPVSSQTPVRAAQRNTMSKAPCCKTHFAFSCLGRGRSTRTVGRQGSGARKRWSLRTCTIAKTVSS